MKLKDKVVFVTGSSRGIGKAIALAFAKEGAHVILNARSPIKQELIEEIASYTHQPLCLVGDVSDYEVVKQMFDTIKQTYGRIDVLVNNAGITKDTLLLRMSESDFDSVYAVNLKGAFNMIRFAVPMMLKQKQGSIINLSSVVGQTGNIGQVNYASMKAGLLGMTKAVAKEVAVKGVTCNAIAPGYIDTDMTKELSETASKQLVDAIPLKRIGEVDDIAQATLFLATAPYITGQVLAVNGGLYM